MRRPRDWERRLAQRLARDRGRHDFAWGSSDCLLWCADVARECLFVDGYDWAASIRGLYADRSGARCLIRARGGMWKSIEAVLAPPYRLPTFARSGDLLALKAGTLGVAWDGEMWGWIETTGLGPIAPVKRCVRAWPVGW